MQEIKLAQLTFIIVSFYFSDAIWLPNL